MNSNHRDIHKERIERLQQMLAEHEIDVAVLQCAPDLFYFTGSVRPSYLLVPSSGEACVLARKALAPIEAEVKHLPLYAFSDTKDLLSIIDRIGAKDAQSVGMTFDSVSYASVERMRKLFPQAAMVDISWETRTQRMVKSKDEIDIMLRAGEIMAQLPSLIRAIASPDITELEMSAALEYAFRLQGHDMLVRCHREGMEISACGVCSAGENTLVGTKFEGICGGPGLSAAVPYGASAAPIPNNVPILLDFGFVLQGYHIDQTRMACIGQPSPEVVNAYAAMLQIEAAICDALRPGAKWEAVYNMAVDLASKLGYADTFMGQGSEQVRFVGHGTGLELDEPPFLAPKMDYPLEANMVLAIEPKVALPGIGVVGIEDTVIIREDGIERITICPQEIVIIDPADRI